MVDMNQHCGFALTRDVLQLFHKKRLKHRAEEIKVMADKNIFRRFDILGFPNSMLNMVDMKHHCGLASTRDVLQSRRCGKLTKPQN